MAKHVTGHVWNIRLAVVESIDKIVQKTASKFIDEETTYSLITNVLKAFEDTKVRVESEQF